MTNDLVYKDYIRKVTNGYDLMKKSRVVICSIVRNCDKALEKNIVLVDLLRSRFLRSSVIVVENDSKDMTKEVLQRWSEKNSDIHILSEDSEVDPLSVGKGGIRPEFSTHRVTLMAEFRNKYMEYLKQEQFESDYIIIIDLDVTKFSIDGVAHSFGQDVKWHAVASNGMSLKQFYTRFIFYDTYSFKEIGDTRQQTEDLLQFYQYSMSGLLLDMPMIRVCSAFNGLAVYTAESMKNLKYRCESNGDKILDATCEHVTFHRDMSKNGFDLMFLNPSQLVFYETRFTKFKRNLCSLKHRLFCRSSSS